VTSIQNNLSRFRGGSKISSQEAALKKIALSGGRRENCWGSSCEKSRFYAKKSYFFPIAEGGANFFWVFRVKNHDITLKNHFFPIAEGGA
jgi:hypothetical protein